MCFARKYGIVVVPVRVGRSCQNLSDLKPQSLFLAYATCSSRLAESISPRHPLSRTHVDGIVTVGNIAGHCGQEKKNDTLLTALKVTHATGAHISLAKACPMATPTFKV